MRIDTLKLIAGIFLGCSLLIWTHNAGAAEDDPKADPVAVYAELDGEWTGEFVGWDTSGRELYRIEVHQSYETVDSTTQKVSIRDRAADGTVTLGTGRNVARRLEDGSLELRCIVEKSNGERVEHAGRLVEGPSGASELVWHSQGEGNEEIFRERVLRENGEEIYAIDGLGRYGETLILMAGRYRRVAE